MVGPRRNVAIAWTVEAAGNRPAARKEAVTDFFMRRMSGFPLRQSWAASPCFPLAAAW